MKVAELEKSPKVNTTKQNYHDLNGQVVTLLAGQNQNKAKQ